MIAIRSRWQESLSKIFGQVLARIIVDGTLFGIPLAVILLFLRDAVWNLLQGIWQTLTVEVPLYISVLLVFATILSILAYRKLKKPSYFFFDYDGVKWKANKRTGETDPTPYCIIHQVQLVWDSHECFYCPVDGERKGLPTKYDIVDTRKGAQNVATAIVNRHLKNTSIPKSG
jgi:hypothetical protein